MCRPLKTTTNTNSWFGESPLQWQLFEKISQIERLQCTLWRHTKYVSIFHFNFNRQSDSKCDSGWSSSLFLLWSPWLRPRLALKSLIRWDKGFLLDYSPAQINPIRTFLPTNYVFRPRTMTLSLCLTLQVWFDLTIGGEPAGRVVIGLFGGTVPKTVRNFKELADKPAGEG